VAPVVRRLGGLDLVPPRALDSAARQGGENHRVDPGGPARRRWVSVEGGPRGGSGVPRARARRSAGRATRAGRSTGPGCSRRKSPSPGGLYRWVSRTWGLRG
jgi:hypothetical protein